MAKQPEDKPTELMMLRDDPTKTSILIDFADMLEYDATHNVALATIIKQDVAKYYETMRQSVSEVFREAYGAERLVDSTTGQGRTFDVRFTNINDEIVSDTKVALLGADYHGVLTKVTGTVTRLYQPDVELQAAAYTCGSCGQKIGAIPLNFRFKQPPVCPNSKCKAKSGFIIDYERSTLGNFQRVIVQESPHNVEPGSTPSTIEVLMRGDTVGLVKPGQTCMFIGWVIAMPDLSVMNLPGEKGTISIHKAAESRPSDAAGVAGFMHVSTTTELTFKYALLVNSIETGTETGAVLTEGTSDIDVLESAIQADPERARRLFDLTGDALEFDESLDPAEAYQNAIAGDMARFPNKVAYNIESFVKSFAPAIHGHLHIKRAIILMLLGGITRVDDVKIRGDINICIVGDPSCGKSQFLSFVRDFHPRAVYTSGKSASGAGITAAVQVDPQTKEFAIMPGAMMLADNGVCCIDEMEKMDDNDQTALHEAMEQGTISINKAGLNATYNSRASVLAAMNPVNGQYDPAKSLRQNIRITPALLSRFDLFFVVRDIPDEGLDTVVARHIIRSHQAALVGQAVSHHGTPAKYSVDEMRDYVTFARAHQPKYRRPSDGGISEAEKLINATWCDLRAKSATGGSTNLDVTARQLEALVRLTEATAKLYLSDYIEVRHVEEAAQLLRATVIQVDHRMGQIEMVTGEDLEIAGVDDVVPAGPGDADFGFVPEGGEGPAPTQPAAPRRSTVDMPLRVITRYQNVIIDIFTERIGRGDGDSMAQGDLIAAILRRDDHVADPALTVNVNPELEHDDGQDVPSDGRKRDILVGIIADMKRPEHNILWDTEDGELAFNIMRG